MSEEHPQTPPSAPERGSSGHQHGHPHLPTFTFLEELKRRNVGRVAILYIILGYVVLEVFGVFVHLLDLPPWVGRSAVLLVVLGFPVALLIAWIYEVTPEGLKPTDEVAPHKSIRHLTGRRLDRAIIAVLAIALSYFIIDKFWLSRHVTPTASAAATISATPAPTSRTTIPEKSVAVLPFVDMSEKHDQEYFSEGLSEELIDKLTKVTDLRVPARTSSFYFKGKQTTIADIARALGVAHVLEGSVRKSGHTLRVTAQLIRVSNGYHLWSETYDRKDSDIFRIQDDIAGSVVSALKASLAGGSITGAMTTTNAEAYRLSLLGRALVSNGVTKADYETAASYLRDALRVDPTFADAWSVLTMALVDATYGSTNQPPSQAIATEMRHAAQRALQLAPTLGSAHAASASISWFADQDLETATAEFRRSVYLDPGSAGYHKALAEVLFASRGASDEVLRLHQRAIELDPVNYNCYLGIGSYYLYVNRFVEAGNAFRTALDLQPQAPDAHLNLGLALLGRGQPTAALAEFDRDPDSNNKLQGEILAYDSIGRKADAEAALSRMINLEPPDAIQVAEVYAYRGELNQSFAWLERAYLQGDERMKSVNRDSLLKHLHADRRWKTLLQKLRLPE